MDSCCGTDKLNSPKAPRAGKSKPIESNPDHSSQLGRLNRAVGQLNGVRRMIEERRYCPEILTQLRAAGAALKGIEHLILGTHLRHCVSEAVLSQNPKQAESKIEELISLLEQQ